MKGSKRVFLSILAFVLMAAMAVSSYAADADLSAHTYASYKIFAGTQSTGSANLAVTGWGDGVDSTKLLEALKKSADFGDTNPFASCTSAADVSAAMSGWTDDDAKAKAFARLAYENKATGTAVTTTSTLEAGYYLIVDTTATNGVESGVKNLALLQLTQKSTLDFAAKVDIPTVVKKVKDNNDSVANSTTDWQDSADFDIGDKVSFKLEATLPNNLSVFPAYKLVFHDKECTGLTFDSTSVKVYIGTSTTALTSGYAVNASPTDGCTFEVTLYDAIASGATAGGTVRVEYEATLNTSAVIGSAGNPNEVFLEYSNNPNWSKSIAVKVSDMVHTVAVTEKDGAVDTVTVDGTQITDATQKQTWLTAVKDLAGGPDGPEKKETGKTVKDKVIVFTYQMEVSKTDGTNALSGADFTLYKFIPGEGNDTYNTVTGTWTTVAKDTATTTTTFVWKGLDEGTYKLSESTVPAGYNGMTDVIFAVNATHDTTADAPALTALTGDAVGGTIAFTKDEANVNALKTTVVNQLGSTLPETGGIGTVIFYAAGSVLVIAAVVLLITKKRMNNSNK